MRYSNGKLPDKKCEIIFCCCGLLIILENFVEFVKLT